MIRRPRGARRWSAAFGVLAVTVLIVLDRSGLLLVPNGDDHEQYDGVLAPVTRVIDGDTFEVELPDLFNDRPVTRVRLWGVDCAEQASPQAGAQPFAAEARAVTEVAIGGAYVLLRLEPSRPRGAFGRVLAHVELEDGRNLAELLLEAGLARADDRWPHSHLRRYEQVENLAKSRGIGLWSESTDRSR